MKHDLNNKNFERKAKRIYSVFARVALLLVATAVPLLAADDPLTVVNNLSDFIFLADPRHWSHPAGLRHPAGGPVPQEPRSLPARQRYADGGRRYRHHLH